MAIVEINWNPTNRQLRQFGMISLFALPMLGWLWSVDLRTMGWLAFLGLVLAIVGVVAPRAIKPVFLALTMVTTPIGMVLGAWCLVLGAWCLVLGAWCLVLGAWCLVLGAW